MGALRLATRGSPQAAAQATAVADALTRATERRVELVIVETTGDTKSEVPLHSIGGQGVFVKEVQTAVLDRRADLAVHSAKDLPTVTADGLTIAAYTERRDARDALVGLPLDSLVSGATVATGSVRRRALIHRLRPDLEFVELRGNIGTRLGKIPQNGSIVMAVAALQILELTDHIAEALPVDQFVPAVGQGCVAVECRIDDDDTMAALSTIDHPEARRAVEIERAFLGELGSGCSLPVGAHVVGERLYTFLADPDLGISLADEIALLGDGHDVERARAAADSARDAIG